MSCDIWIADGKLAVIDRSDSDATILPDYSPREGSTLISEADWIALVDDAGSEAAVMEAFGVKEDLRDEDGWRYVPETVSHENHCIVPDSRS